ncbi:hypothetical protein [Actinopolyspora saharensis]|uniref:hypothetical protein n=1 Tax=Actinopolyspora saharensis TaxID=995062 RepID=UPI003F66B864
MALFLLLSPFLIVFGWIREWLELFGVVRESEVKTDTKPAPGVILVSGSTDNPVLTELIDTVKRTQRPLWLVVSRTRVTVLVMNNPAKPPRVVWQTDDTATIRFHHAALHSIEITWPDGSRAYLCPTIEERKIITSFVNATWNNEPR